MSQVSAVDGTNDGLGQASIWVQRCCYTQSTAARRWLGGGILFPFAYYIPVLTSQLSIALCALFTVRFIKARGPILLPWNCLAHLWLDLLYRKHQQLLRKALYLMKELGWTFFEQTNTSQQFSVRHRMPFCSFHRSIVLSILLFLYI